MSVTVAVTVIWALVAFTFDRVTLVDWIPVITVAAATDAPETSASLETETLWALAAVLVPFL